MNHSNNNQGYLAFLHDIYEVSSTCGTVTYIWGGFTLDIVEGQFLREHYDLDGFTLNLLDVLPEMMAAYNQRGYSTTFREDIDMLVIRKNDLHAAFNRLEIDCGIAMWRHIGNEGTVYFPEMWLDTTPHEFYDTQVYTAGLQLDYALKTNTRLIHATWELRQKDHTVLAQLKTALANRSLNPETFLRQVWSFNPFWVKHGYSEYAMPVVARPLLPPERDAQQKGIQDDES